MKDIYQTIRDEAAAMSSDIVAWRRHFHRNPELSFKETATTEFVVNKLREFGYTDISTGFGPIKTGVTAILGSGKPCVMLRADMDALPIEEKTGLEFASCVKGVSHACGHDAHTACLLAAAKLLKLHEQEISGRVKLVFQPAEETRCKIFEKPLSGAGYVARSGAVDDVDAAFGMHVWGRLPAGKIYIKDGPTMMASGRFNLKVIGKGTHGASPHLGHDPITTACQVVDAIQTIVSREVSLLTPGLITIGTIHGGTATNIIPGEVELSGTVRSAQLSTVEYMIRRIGEVAELTAQAHLCSTQYTPLINGPAVINTPAMADIVREAGRAVLGAEGVQETEMMTGSEDFREYTARVPGAFFFTGMQCIEKGCDQPQHDPAFRVNEDVLAGAAAVMASVAFKYFVRAQRG